MSGQNAGGFSIDLDQYRLTYGKLYDLHLELQKEIQKIDSFISSIPKNAGGELTEAQDSWNHVQISTRGVKQKLQNVDNQVKLHLLGMADSYKSYRNEDDQAAIEFMQTSTLS
ncbi:hypothetical protein KEM60_01280 [Austwickia sp. TVS 96-490-7B]|uniref:hypothetical protein n=1 Tax=Austwickia sp. TVS 96-490-7B TaxID=2830843 RepID=UPI001C58BAF9|nr:hypothetical protein [Austwickia sp. TVS 96-490-7B]MBW3085088.1 hypothetical protein [Austwickia sp. TVS 96-490-7B]